MATWLDDLYEVYNQLDELGHAQQVRMIRIRLYSGLKDDDRYAGVVADTKRHTSWSMSEICNHLESVATELDDLLPDFHLHTPAGVRLFLPTSNHPRAQPWSRLYRTTWGPIARHMGQSRRRKSPQLHGSKCVSITRS